MITECANPECKTRFEYHLGGKFYRFHQKEIAPGNQPNVHSVVHFWLCPNCANDYTLGYDGTHCLMRGQEIGRGTAAREKGATP